MLTRISDFAPALYGAAGRGVKAHGRAEAFNIDPEGVKTPNVSFSTHIDEGKSRLRLSSLSHMDWPKALVYDGINTGRGYVLRLTGRGEALPRADFAPRGVPKLPSTPPTQV